MSTAVRNVYAATCPTRTVLDRVADKWATLILGALVDRPRRFGEIARVVEGISPRSLSRTLRDLERDGLILRTLLSTDPPAVSYSLTRLGRSLDACIAPLRSWAETHVDQIISSQVEFDNGSSAEDRTPWQRPRPAP